MTIAYDIHGSTWSTGNVASLTTSSFTIGGSDRYLVAGVCSGAGTPVNPTEARWGGSGGTLMTKESTTLDVGATFKTSMYRLLAPTAQTSTLYCLWPSNQDETALGGISFTGVDQTTPVRSSASATGTGSPTVNVTTVADDMVVDVMWAGEATGTSTTLAVGGSQTSRIEIEGTDLGGFEALGMSHETATGTSVTMSWTITDATTNNWGIRALPLIPAAAAGGGARTSQFAGQPMLRGPF
jgi:hypothetical protein